MAENQIEWTYRGPTGFWLTHMLLLLNFVGLMHRLIKQKKAKLDHPTPLMEAYLYCDSQRTPKKNSASRRTPHRHFYIIARSTQPRNAGKAVNGRPPPLAAT